jgi:hypothetical protein
VNIRMNYASCSEVLLNLLDAIRRKRPDQVARGLLLHHDNASPMQPEQTQEGLQELQ